MRYRNILAATLVAGALISCGGGGSPGLPPATAPATGTGGSTDQPAVATAKVTVDVLNGSGTSTTSISGVEIAQVKAVLKDANGAPVPGAIVTFSEASGSLLTYAPASKTALTDTTGAAVVEIRAASSSNTGATTVAAGAMVGGATVTAQKSIAITSAPSTGAVDPQVLANAISFLSVDPADKSIVLQGSGGTGRLESATLRYRVVDTNNSPVKGAQVAFTVSPPNDVTLNIPNAVSDSDGVVVTTVSSKSTPTAVRVTATIAGKAISSLSDQLTVTTGVPTQAGFDLAASKYNMNSNLSGDSSTITVKLRDANGNPVADGVPVVFTATHGVVGTSGRGGCLTSNGECAVEFRVQEPRSADGVLALVTASTQLGDGSTIGKALDFRMVDVGLLDVFIAATGGSAIPKLGGVARVGGMSTCDATTFTFYVGTPGNFPPAAGTTIALKPITAGLTATLVSASPVQDQLSNPPTRERLVFQLAQGAPLCPQGGTPSHAEFDISFTIGGITMTRSLSVN
ncbi:hypothetical protein QTI24_17845 [Variovorax sp. J22P240]|uniref:Ig-like domain-containing protein n=1 Tax=Variovorax sp. J22P240 TaxID=3053514 RepID=UPI0025757F64|nr:hypothetical protein [Variovorax sp. J22P240]MDM0000487.1 hypothetical protein [Variovorax sp. J22P240]